MAIVLFLVCAAITSTGVRCAEVRRNVEQDSSIDEQRSLLNRSNDEVLVQRFVTLFTDIMLRDIHIKQELDTVENDLKVTATNFESNINARLDNTSKDIYSLNEKLDSNTDSSTTGMNFLKETIDNSSVDIDYLKQHLGYSTVDIKSLKQKMDNLTVEMNSLKQKFNADQRELTNTIKASIKDEFKTVKKFVINEINDLKNKMDAVQLRLKSCQSGYTGTAYGCYKVVWSEKVSWETAKTRCETNGTHLVSLESSEEGQALGALMESQGASTRAYWTGGKKMRRQWRWTRNDKPFSYTNWLPHRPLGVGSCARLEYQPGNARHHLKWNDFWCHFSYFYICEA